MSLREAALATLKGHTWSDGQTSTGVLTGEQIIAVYRAIEQTEQAYRSANTNGNTDPGSADPTRAILTVFYPSNPEWGTMSDRRIDKSLQKLKRMKLVRYNKAKRRWTTEG